MKSYNDKITKMDNVELVMMSYDRTDKAALDWAKKESFPWPTVLGQDKDAVHFGSVEILGVPTYILFNADGDIVTRGKDDIFKKLEEIKK
ncbi:TlpA family protein disulfide reductase [Rubritalea tangerina]|uniref:TlpA family protein disulfide reductase n=1 Tax=Rubritalea tangerina TaxID=430798 RepID=A0ABW4ZB07_9BACT